MNFTREPMSLKEQVILSLKDFRKNKNISQSQLADRIGVSRDTIARLESGRARMYLELIEKIAHELNVKILELSDKVEQLETDTETKSRFYNNYKINYLNYPNAYPQPIKSSPMMGKIPKGEMGISYTIRKNLPASYSAEGDIKPLPATRISTKKRYFLMVNP